MEMFDGTCRDQSRMGVPAPSVHRDASALASSKGPWALQNVQKMRCRAFFLITIQVGVVTTSQVGVVTLQSLFIHELRTIKGCALRICLNLFTTLMCTSQAPYPIYSFWMRRQM